MGDLERELLYNGWYRAIDSRKEIVYANGSMRKIYNKELAKIVAEYDINIEHRRSHLDKPSQNFSELSGR